MKASNMGITDTKAPDVSRFQICSDADPAELRTCHCESPTVMGKRLGLVSTTDGRKKLFHAPTTDSSSTVVIAGVMIGSETVRNVLNSPAPSTRAASIISSGNDSLQ